MECENKVHSEVHQFAEKVIGETKSGDAILQKNIDGTCVEQALEEDESIVYECILGSNGEVALWDPNLERVISRLEFKPPSTSSIDSSSASNQKFDEDGDLVYPRKKNEIRTVILIEQQLSSSLELVGEQLWRGAFFLADYILENFDYFKNKTVLELAAGVGLTSIVASIPAKKVIISDVDRGCIFQMIRSNLKRNEDLIKADMQVSEIDFMKPETVENLKQDLSLVDIIIAADVVYDNNLTDSFMRTILDLFKINPDKVMYISLEKRYVFTIADLDTVAPCYEHFLVGLKWLQEQETDSLSWNVQLLDADFTQSFMYERSRHLVLWKISASKK